MLTDEQWEQITDAWLSDEYSPVAIMQETGISLDDIEVAIRRIDYVNDVTRKSMLAKVKEALDLED